MKTNSKIQVSHDYYVDPPSFYLGQEVIITGGCNFMHAFITGIKWSFIENEWLYDLDDSYEDRGYARTEIFTSIEEL
jgi:hypothetical protein